ncbi:hypothetical protein IMY05_012G0049500 [Salix suchowensis]|nr:hypothetical protein IMY05_012G0049500 [Salix suchowensis]
MSSKHRSNNSLCEKSMKVVVIIINLSSFSIAKMSQGTHGPPVVTNCQSPMTGSVMVANEPSLSKPISFVMHPDEGNGSTHAIHKDNSIIDGRHTFLCMAFPDPLKQLGCL